MNCNYKQQINNKDKNQKDSKDRLESKTLKKIKSSLRKTELPNIYNLKSILEYNNQLRTKELEKENKNTLPSVIKRIKHGKKEESLVISGLIRKEIPSQSSNMNRTLTRKSTSISKDDKSQRRDASHDKNYKSDYSKVSNLAFKKNKRDSVVTKLGQETMNKDLIEELNNTSNNFKKRKNRYSKPTKHVTENKADLLTVEKHKSSIHNEIGRTSVNSVRKSNRSQISTRSKNRYGDISSLRAQYEKKHGPSNTDLKRAEEEIKEASMLSPRASNQVDNNSILWENIDEKLKNNDELDEDEILELRHNLEQRKREALIKDMLLSNGIKEVDNEKLKLLTESK